MLSHAGGGGEARASGPVGGAHGLLALRLDLGEFQRRAAGTNPHVLLAHLQLAGLKLGRSVGIGLVGRLRGENMQGEGFSG